MLGIGAIIGTGIFVVTGVASAVYAGASIDLVICLSGFLSLSYQGSLLRSLLPVSLY